MGTRLLVHSIALPAPVHIRIFAQVTRNESYCYMRIKVEQIVAKTNLSRTAFCTRKFDHPIKPLELQGVSNDLKNMKNN